MFGILGKRCSRSGGRRGNGLRLLSVFVESDSGVSRSPFRQRIKVGKHDIISDEPENVGGKDEGLSPYELLLSALGSCTSMTLEMYAKRKKLPLEGVCVELNHNKIYLKDCEECEQEDDDGKRKGKIDRIERKITLHGDNLTQQDREKLLKIANLCPVHKTLESSSIVATSLKPEVIASSSSSSSSSVASSTSTSKTKLKHLLRSKSHVLVPGAKPEFIIRRLIPVIEKRFVGPWVFFDHYGPVDVSSGKSMDVGPHPHIGLATLSFLFEGAIFHRDSTGAEALIKPGEVNLMVAGKGVVHSERGNEALEHIEENEKGEKIVHGIQTWLALPKESEDCEPSFHHTDKVPDISQAVTTKGNVLAKLVLGEMFGAKSEVPLHWPGFMIDFEMQKDSVATFSLQPDEECAVYVAAGRCESGPEETVLDVGESAIYSKADEAEKQADLIEIKTRLDSGARVIVFGGLPFPEKRNMFWNFVSSDKSKIATAAGNWQALDRSQFPKVVNESNEDSIPLPNKSFNFNNKQKNQQPLS